MAFRFFLFVAVEARGVVALDARFRAPVLAGVTGDARVLAAEERERAVDDQVAVAVVLDDAVVLAVGDAVCDGGATDDARRLRIWREPSGLSATLRHSRCHISQHVVFVPRTS